MTARNSAAASKSIDQVVEAALARRPFIETEWSKFEQKKRESLQDSSQTPYHPSQPLIILLNATHQRHALMDTEQQSGQILRIQVDRAPLGLALE